MAMQTPKDTPFGLEPNVAAGLAYVLALLGGIIIFVGGGTNRFVKFAAAQSIVLWGGYIILQVGLSVLRIILYMMHLWPLGALLGIVGLLLSLLALVAWIFTSISGFQGKEIRLPVVADLTARFFPGV